MKTAYRLFASALTAGALALPGAAMAQANGGANPALNKTTTNMPSQRIVQGASNGQGAALTISPAGVREVQQALNRLGYSAGPVTGNWDQPTQRAMQSYQAAHGLEPNGNLTISSIAGLGLWNNLIGNPNGNGNKTLVSQNASGAPPARGSAGGTGGSLGSAGGSAGGGASGMNAGGGGNNVGGHNGK